MADNTQLDAAVGTGDTIRDKDRAGVKTQIVGLDLGIGSGTESLMNGVMPVSDNSGSLTVDDGGGSLTVDGTVGVSGTVTVDSELTTADVDTGAGTDTRAVVGLVKAASGGGVLVSDANPLPVSDGGGSLTVDGTVSITANSSVNVAQVAGTTTDTNSGNKSAGTQRVVLATDQPALTNSQPAKLAPTTDSANGHSISRVVSAASTNATSAKASAGKVFGWVVSNTNAAGRYLKLYNKASAPTVGTDVPVMTIFIPPGAMGHVLGETGIAFSTGIAYALTTGATDADTGAVAANEVIVNLLYQ